MASGQQVKPTWPDALLRLVRNCFSAESARKVGKAMKACASEMLIIPVSFTKRARKPKIQTGFVPSKVSILRVRLKVFK